MKYFDFFYFRGRLALAEILKAFNLSNKKVGVLGFTCVAVPQAILSIGAKPVWIDTNKKLFSMNLEDLKKKIKKIDALIVQHTFGMQENLAAINLINKNKIPIIEDCCHSSLNNNFRFSDAKFYSFERGKLINLMLGGALKVKDKRIRFKLDKSYKKNFINTPFLVSAKIFIMAIGYIFYQSQFKINIRKIYYYLCKKKIFISNYNQDYLDNVYLENYKLTFIQKFFLKKKIKNINKIKKIILLNKKKLNKLFNKKFEGFILKYPFLVKNKKKILQKLKKSELEYSNIYASPIHPLKISNIRKIKKLNYRSCYNAESLTEKIISIDISKKLFSDTDLIKLKNLLY
jgi:dTDP-4-amino-4,6-dideoxygalactose transaminase